MRLKRRELLVVSGAALLAASGVTTFGAGSAAAAADDALLKAALAAVPGAREVITVAAPSMSSTDAQLSAWAPQPQGWTKVFGPIPAKLGSQGLGQSKDNIPRTPYGVFGLDQAFGRQPNPGTAMPYTQVDSKTWWDGNPKSATYDRMVTGADPGPGSENLYGAGPVYDYAVHFNQNPGHTPGDGSAFFLHVTDGTPTEGCVAVGKGSMVSLLKWLSPSYSPVLVTGLAG
jgi:L,D-peptidoglycan transpeptidase YkuD (ErfK/YbiS/YcfS/YnhG family)